MNHLAVYCIRWQEPLVPLTAFRL
eukprot:SAG31_NODE_11631_length_1011_cov_1.368421_2_plen_23_part_01